MRASSSSSPDSMNLAVDTWSSGLGIHIDSNRDRYSSLLGHEPWLDRLNIWSNFITISDWVGGNSGFQALINHFPSLYSSRRLQTLRNARSQPRLSGWISAAHQPRSAFPSGDQLAMEYDELVSSQETLPLLAPSSNVLSLIASELSVPFLPRVIPKSVSLPRLSEGSRADSGSINSRTIVAGNVEGPANRQHVIPQPFLADLIQAERSGLNPMASDGRSRIDSPAAHTRQASWSNPEMLPLSNQHATSVDPISQISTINEAATIGGISDSLQQGGPSGLANSDLIPSYRASEIGLKPSDALLRQPSSDTHDSAFSVLPKSQLSTNHPAQSGSSVVPKAILATEALESVHTMSGTDDKINVAYSSDAAGHVADNVALGDDENRLGDSSIRHFAPRIAMQEEGTERPDGAPDLRNDKLFLTGSESVSGAGRPHGHRPLPDVESITNSVNTVAPDLNIVLAGSRGSAPDNTSALGHDGALGSQLMPQWPTDRDTQLNAVTPESYSANRTTVMPNAHVPIFGDQARPQVPEQSPAETDTQSSSIATGSTSSKQASASELYSELPHAEITNPQPLLGAEKFDTGSHEPAKTIPADGAEKRMQGSWHSPALNLEQRLLEHERSKAYQERLLDEARPVESLIFTSPPLSPRESASAADSNGLTAQAAGDASPSALQGVFNVVRGFSSATDVMGDSSEASTAPSPLSLQERSILNRVGIDPDPIGQDQMVGLADIAHGEEYSSWPGFAQSRIKFDMQGALLDQRLDGQWATLKSLIQSLNYSVTNPDIVSSVLPVLQQSITKTKARSQQFLEVSAEADSVQGVTHFGKNENPLESDLLSTTPVQPRSMGLADILHEKSTKLEPGVDLWSVIRRVLGNPGSRAASYVVGPAALSLVPETNGSNTELNTIGNDEARLPIASEPHRARPGRPSEAISQSQLTLRGSVTENSSHKALEYSPRKILSVLDVLSELGSDSQQDTFNVSNSVSEEAVASLPITALRDASGSSLTDTATNSAWNNELSSSLVSSLKAAKGYATGDLLLLERMLQQTLNSAQGQFGVNDSLYTGASLTERISDGAGEASLEGNEFSLGQRSERPAIQDSVGFIGRVISEDSNEFNAVWMNDELPSSKLTRASASDSQAVALGTSRPDSLFRQESEFNLSNGVLAEEDWTSHSHSGRSSSGNLLRGSGISRKLNPDNDSSTDHAGVALVEKLQSELLRWSGLSTSSLSLQNERPKDIVTSEGDAGKRFLHRAESKSEQLESGAYSVGRDRSETRVLRSNEVSPSKSVWNWQSSDDPFIDRRQSALTGRERIDEAADDDVRAVVAQPVVVTDPFVASYNDLYNDVELPESRHSAYMPGAWGNSSIDSARFVRSLEYWSNKDSISEFSRFGLTSLLNDKIPSSGVARDQRDGIGEIFSPVLHSERINEVTEVPNPSQALRWDSAESVRPTLPQRQPISVYRTEVAHDEIVPVVPFDAKPAKMDYAGNVELLSPELEPAGERVAANFAGVADSGAQSYSEKELLNKPLLTRVPASRDSADMVPGVFAAPSDSRQASSHSDRSWEDLEKVEKEKYFNREVSAENRAFEMALMEIRWRMKFTDKWDLERE